MLLSYLNERMPSPVRANASAHNLDVAQRMELEKFHLIDGLSLFPATVLWLINKYEHCYVDDDADTAPTKLNEALKNLINLNLIVQQNLSENDYQFIEDSQEKLNIASVLHTFPFAFEDLVELTDLVVYTYQLSGLNYQTNEKPSVWQSKRLQQLTRLNSSTLPHQLKAAGITQDLLLCLPNEFIVQSVMNCVSSEHLWLKLRQQLVANNVKLVTFIANQYKSEFLDFDDLVQEGQTGLLMAADRFDHRFGCQFSTYAAYWIKQRISRALSQHERVVRVPYEQLNNINKLFRAKEEWLLKTGKEPTVSELATVLELSEHDVSTLLFIAQTSLSLENFSGDEEDESLAPIDLIEQQVFLQADKNIAETELKSWLELAMKALNSREAKVIREHFGLEANDELTLQEIGNKLNISRERVRQIQAMAFNKMKLNYGEQLVSFL